MLFIGLIMIPIVVRGTIRNRQRELGLAPQFVDRGRRFLCVVGSTRHAQRDFILSHFFSDDIDHTTHRLITVQYPGTALQNFDLLDIIQTDGRQIRRCGIGRVIQPASIDQDQGITHGSRAEAA